MEVNIEWIINDSGIDGIEYVCGRSRGDNRIEGVHIMDNPDTYRFFKKGELVITTGYVFKQMQDTEIKAMIKAMNDKGCCGIAFKINRFYDTIPELIVDEAKRWSIPVLAIPSQVAISDLQTIVLREIFEQERNAERKTESDNSFFELFFDKNISQKELEYSCRENGFSTKSRYCAVIYNLTNYVEQKKAAVRGMAEEDFACFTFWRGQYFVIIIRIPEKVNSIEAREHIKEYAAEVYTRMRSNCEEKIDIGISDAGDYASISDLYHQAVSSMMVNSAIGDWNTLTYEEQAVYHFLMENMTEAMLKRMAMPLVSRLDEELLITLEELVLSGWKYKETAGKLFIHRNTLLFRKSKIFAELSMSDIPSQVVQLEMCVYAHKILKDIYHCALAQ